MEKEIKENLIQVSGKVGIEQAPELGSEVTVAFKGTVVQKKECDNQDGTITWVYVVKPTKAKTK